jgi:hypothetical protein
VTPAEAYLRSELIDCGFIISDLSESVQDLKEKLKKATDKPVKGSKADLVSEFSS